MSTADRPPLPGIEEYAASHLADRLTRFAATLRDWADTVDRTASEIRGMHATKQHGPRPYAFAVAQLSGRMQGITHDLASFGSDAAEVETYRAVERFRAGLAAQLERDAGDETLPPGGTFVVRGCAEAVKSFDPSSKG